MICEKCRSDMLIYDTIIRYLRDSNGNKNKKYINRYCCPRCKIYRRQLPDEAVSRIRYSKDIFIKAVYSDNYTEDYPCDKTIERWKRKVKDSL